MNNSDEYLNIHGSIHDQYPHLLCESGLWRQTFLGEYSKRVCLKGPARVGDVVVDQVIVVSPGGGGHRRGRGHGGEAAAGRHRALPKEPVQLVDDHFPIG